jgi:hypothetical protein
MAGLIRNALTRLLPNGHAWRPATMTSAVLDALAESIDRVLAFLSDVRAESTPRTATNTIGEWYASMGIKYTPTIDLTTARGQIDSAYTSVGGQSIGYLNDQVKKQFPGVSIEEQGSDFSYLVFGDVNTTNDYSSLLGLIDRLAPLHLAPVFNIRIIETLTTAYTGISIAGKARTGNTN